MLSHGIKRILLIGQDLGLLRRRVGPLARTGAQVVVSEPAELETHTGTESFDLLILCHTLPDLVRRSVTENARRRWPRVKILQIFERSGDVASIGCRLDDHTSDNGNDLIQHAEELLGRSA